MQKDDLFAAVVAPWPVVVAPWNVVVAVACLLALAGAVVRGSCADQLTLTQMDIGFVLHRR